MTNQTIARGYVYPESYYLEEDIEKLEKEKQKIQQEQEAGGLKKLLEDATQKSVETVNEYVENTERNQQKFSNTCYLNPNQQKQEIENKIQIKKRKLNALQKNE